VTSIKPLHLIIVFCAAAWTSSCSRSEKSGTVEAATPSLPIVAVAKVSVEDMSRQLVLTAEFRPFQEIDVMSKVAGFVKGIYVDVGDRVQQGQLLAELEIPEMADDITRGRAAIDRSQAGVARAKDEIQRAESSHQIAHLSYDRLSAVAKRQTGLIAQQELDDAHSKDLVAEAQLSAAKSNLAMTEQQVHVNAAELQKFQTLSAYTRVTAPFSGIVTKRYADTGSMVQAGTASSTQAMPLVKLSENRLLRLVLPVPESAVPTVHVGQQVEVRVPSLNRSLPGKVARFASKVASATRTMDTEVDVENPDFVLIPGMFAEVDLTLERRNKALSIPIPAVDLNSDASSGQVMVITPDGRIAIRKVALGIQTATNVEVRSGLGAGELVVVGNRSDLHADEQVRPKLSDTEEKR
jgi:RND family efflux transporter MFP subunit